LNVLTVDDPVYDVPMGASPHISLNASLGSSNLEDIQDKASIFNLDDNNSFDHPIPPSEVQGYTPGICLMYSLKSRKISEKKYVSKVINIVYILTLVLVSSYCQNEIRVE